MAAPRRIEPVDGAYRHAARPAHRRRVGRRGRRPAAAARAGSTRTPPTPRSRSPSTSARTGLPEVVRDRIVAAVGAGGGRPRRPGRDRSGATASWRGRRRSTRLDEAAAPPPPPRARTRPEPRRTRGAPARQAGGRRTQGGPPAARRRRLTARHDGTTRTEAPAEAGALRRADCFVLVPVRRWTGSLCSATRITSSAFFEVKAWTKPAIESRKSTMAAM